jgi:uncharacterized repeat protein (TIGR01451 family)
VRGPSPIARVLLAACAASSTLGASFWVASRTSPSTVAIPQLSGPNYARDVSGFHQVTRDLVADLSAQPQAKPNVKPHPVRSTPTTVPDVHAPSPSVPSPEPTVAPAPSAALAISMAANMARAHPNQTIVYTIRVSNTGPVTAHGVIIQSHVPDGTSLQGWKCNGTSVLANGADHFTCGTVGSAHPDHPLVFALSSLAPGASVVETFWVRIDHNVGHNTNIVDHAHAFAENADVVDSALVSVVIK